MSDEQNQSVNEDGASRKDSNAPLNSEMQFQVSDDSCLEDPDDFTLATLSEAYLNVLDRESESEVPDPSGHESTESQVEEQREESEENDDAGCPISPESIVESILFVGSPKNVKLTGKKIASILRDVSPKEISRAVDKLNARYEEYGSAWRISFDDGSYGMVLHDSLESFKNEYFGRNRQVKLNQSTIDVLAVVAYHQPVTREQVDKIRGKSSGSILRQLVKRELLVLEKSEGPTVLKQYRTTDRFLDVFGLAELEDLPQSHEVADIEDLAD